MRIGTRVVVERYEKKYPPRGTWKRFRGRRGIITCTALGEIGVSFNNDLKHVREDFSIHGSTHE